MLNDYNFKVNSLVVQKIGKLFTGIYHVTVLTYWEMLKEKVQ